jgi:hypothetical protein
MGDGSGGNLTAGALWLNPIRPVPSPPLGKTSIRFFIFMTQGVVNPNMVMPIKGFSASPARGFFQEIWTIAQMAAAACENIFLVNEFKPKMG